MSLRPDGSYRCDRCGTDVGNAAVTECAVVSDLEDGDVRVLHYCREPNKGAPRGCAAHLLSPTNIAAYRKPFKTAATGNRRDTHSSGFGAYSA